jgi:hypothetical protein
MGGKEHRAVGVGCACWGADWRARARSNPAFRLLLDLAHAPPSVSGVRL